jgi:uncharacterized membrane protein YedE/YeeE
MPYNHGMNISPDFTPLPALVGGLVIGLAASLLLLTHGKVAGISGIFAGLFDRATHDKSYRLAFVLGLVVVGLVARLAVPELLPASSQSLGVIAVAGLLVGYGTRLGNGCTSGHGICGLSRLSARSLIAVVTFIGTGMLTVLATRLVGG